jgi:hypothetical protein
VVDDLQLEPPRVLSAFLDRDPRWRREVRTPKWAAYARLSQGGLREDWSEQPFLKVRVPLRTRVKRTLRVLDWR